MPDQNKQRVMTIDIRMVIFKLLIWACVFGTIPLALYFIIVSPQAGLFSEFVSSCSMALLIPGLVVSIGTLSYFLLQALLAYCYKDAVPAKDEDLPKLSVIVPAYNEGAYVATALKSILECDYPPEKLEVIAVNDGSEDDTIAWIERAARESDGRIRAIDLTKNGGKKRALCEGIRIATGSVIVTVDSDSRLTRDALKKISARFTDPKVGAVAGNIRVTNLNEGYIPRMLDVTFAFGFEFMRTAQCQVHSVLCTPGALSAYRLSAILPLLETWKAQTFFGRPSTIGEDRAITSLLIKNGWYADFQRDAIAFTKMPVTYKGLCRMMIRWCRSDVRENAIMLWYALKKFRPWDMLHVALQINLIFSAAAVLLPFVTLPMLAAAFVISPAVTFFYTLTGSMLWSMMPAFIYAARYSVKDAVWAFVYGLYCIPFISWICIYSVLTVGNSNWLTRTLPEKKDISLPNRQSEPFFVRNRRRLTATQRIARRKLRTIPHFSSPAGLRK